MNFLLSDVRQMAFSFYDSLAKVSQMAIQSKGTACTLGKPEIFSVLEVLLNILRVFKVIVILSSFDICLYL